MRAEDDQIALGYPDTIILCGVNQQTRRFERGSCEICEPHLTGVALKTSLFVILTKNTKLPCSLMSSHIAVTRWLLQKKVSSEGSPGYGFTNVETLGQGNLRKSLKNADSWAAYICALYLDICD